MDMLERLTAALAPFMGQARVSAGAPPVPGQSILGPGFPIRAPIPFDRREKYPELSFQGTIDDVGVNCPFIRETLATHGAGLTEPLWRDSLRVALYTRHPLEAAHALSSGHAEST